MTSLTTVDSTLIYKKPDSAQLLTEATMASDTASFIVITDAETLAFATSEMNAYAKRIKELDAMRKAITKPMDDAKKGVMALFKPAIERYTAAVGTLKDGIAAYQLEKQRIAAEANADAERKAAAEREALKAEAEKAETAEEREALMEVASAVVAVETKAEKPEGVTLVKRWKAKVDDKAAFVRYVSEHPEMLDCLDVNTSAINAFARQTAGSVKVDGLTVYQDVSVACR